MFLDACSVGKRVLQQQFMREVVVMMVMVAVIAVATITRAPLLLLHLPIFPILAHMALSAAAAAITRLHSSAAPALLPAPPAAPSSLGSSHPVSPCSTLSVGPPELVASTGTCWRVTLSCVLLAGWGNSMAGGGFALGAATHACMHGLDGNNAKMLICGSISVATIQIPNMFLLVE